MIGGGAREHALVWKLSGERGVSEVICAPGNAGIARLARCLETDPTDPEALFELATRERVDLTIVGPEQALAAGVADRFAADGRLLFGPSRRAAELESSKVFAKDFMARHGVPTADYQVCETSDAAVAALDSGRFGYPVVLKADGLAAGKGVVVARDRAEAMAAIQSAMVDRRFGAAGARLLVEHCLQGVEVSWFTICDGQRALPMISAQDHKRAFDDDRGPNTGGMGAFAPSPLVDDEMRDRIMRDIVNPTIAGLAAEGREFRGLLYAGLMLVDGAPQVIEFNVRFGDPEAQVVLPAVEGDLLPALVGAAAGDLADVTLSFRDDRHVGVVLASGGYPGTYEVGKPIAGLASLDTQPDTLVFHAGTARRGADVVTSGGRVLTVVGRGADFAQAIARAYEATRGISFEGRRFRTDIGRRAVTPDRSG